MTLKHQKGRLSLNDLMIAISIKEQHRNQTHKMPVEHQPRANLIVEKWKVNKVNSNSVAINTGKTTQNKKTKSKQTNMLELWEVGHWAKLCPNKKAKTGQATVNMVVGGANVHVCADKTCFAPYQAITRKTVSIGNSCTAEVLGIGSVDVKFPSERILS
ncbi:UNVERIFIED_CONTAM: hypothetical protein Sangu_3022000 [Sesamum angustifolium]|uniref:Retrovirus-related Pol polyprotein from transposon TNT 1-94-like beta-barrel domain-containing protein n=1 Tax=Sesamum angustifolium TaxID=2727405 RepID=A0AAW2KL49_9LAMI